ncbi:hypothetical protein C8J57DRAFT_218447 [Mycena rebaudengoi]|nr:hypothetical protein C8J57DRAFT_218447 [Mycena rebaudengoi]
MHLVQLFFYNGNWPDKFTGQAPAKPSQRVLVSTALFGDPLDSGNSWIAENERTIKALFSCIEELNCGPNQQHVVILGASPFRGVLGSENGGEAIWANSTILALKNLGYSYLYSLNMERTMQLYYMFRELVLSILLDASDTQSCFQDHECILMGHKPYGIPA